MLSELELTSHQWESYLTNIDNQIVTNTEFGSRKALGSSPSIRDRQHDKLVSKI